MQPLRHRAEDHRQHIVEARRDRLLARRQAVERRVAAAGEGLLVGGELDGLQRQISGDLALGEKIRTLQTQSRIAAPSSWRASTCRNGGSSRKPSKIARFIWAGMPKVRSTPIRTARSGAFFRPPAPVEGPGRGRHPFGRKIFDKDPLQMSLCKVILALWQRKKRPGVLRKDRMGGR